MNRKHIMVIGISVFLLFYFLFPVIKIDFGCQFKEHKLGSHEGIVTNSSTWAMFDYTVFLLNGGQLEQGSGKCIMYH